MKGFVNGVCPTCDQVPQMLVHVDVYILNGKPQVRLNVAEEKYDVGIHPDLVNTNASMQFKIEYTVGKLWKALTYSGVLATSNAKIPE